MKNVLKNVSLLSKTSGHPSLFPLASLSFLMVLLVMFSGCGNNTGNTVNTGQVSSALAAGVKGYPVTVYFPKRNPQGLVSETKIFPVQRLSTTKAVATTALQLLIAGPTALEQKAGYYSDLGSMLRGPSTCRNGQGGADFRLTLDRRGKFVEVGTATLQFCRKIIGIAAIPDAIVRDQIGETLEQFPTIKKVLILKMDGSCFQNESLEGKYCESYQPG
ncbi:GerMN domain-containing protein [Ktedonosporobacter rubrisoli]|nr:GerMN domain-containing protein [Ktedonosporobacter rubrisoli]